MQKLVNNFNKISAGFSLVFEKEKGAADFSYKQDHNEKVGENEKQILFHISKNDSITYKELGDLIGITEKCIIKILRVLIYTGLLHLAINIKTYRNLWKGSLYKAILNCMAACHHETKNFSYGKGIHQGTEIHPRRIHAAFH